MAIRILPDPKRDRKAAELAQSGGSWIRYTLAQPCGAFPIGTPFYGVPSASQPGAVYMANGDACKCPDYQTAGNVCYHVRAVRLYEDTLAVANGLAPDADVDAYQSDRSLDRASMHDATVAAMRNIHVMATVTQRPPMVPEVRAARIAQRDRIAATAPPLRAYVDLFPAIVD